VVASDIPPHIELSESGEFARLFRTGDPDDAASKILDLLSSVSARSDLAACAYRHAMDNLSVDAYVKKLRSMYEELLQK
jgi:glycosyltransferase involved in cell wall biosynthesis